MKFLVRIFICILISLQSVGFAADSTNDAYQNASDCYHEVRKLPRTEQSRAKWHKCIKLFDEAAKKTDSDKADDAIFSAGLSYRRIYEITGNEEDARDAVNKFNELSGRYSKSQLADDALFNMATLQWEVLGEKEGAVKSLQKIISWHPDGDMADTAADYLKSIGVSNDPLKTTRKYKISDKPVRIISIEKKSGENSQSLIMKLSGPAKTSGTQAKHSVSGHDRFTLELENTHFSRMIDLGYSYVGDGLIRDVETIQKKNNIAVVNTIIKSGNVCESVDRGLEIEITCGPNVGVKSAQPSTDMPVKAAANPAAANESKVSLSRNIDESGGRKAYSVVIDAGHGGTEDGAIGKAGTREKDVTLLIAKRIGWQLRNKYGIDVNYTRIDDRTLSLDDRNKIGNGFEPDLFISVHANAAGNPALDGYQTFFLNNASDEASRRLAERENASMGKNANDLEKIILTLMQNANTDESRLLANSIHKKVLSKMSKYALKDRGVRSALFYVLVGSRCPAVLIETSFISNEDEEKKLKDSDYQENIAKAISAGIKEYLDTSKTIDLNL